MSCSSGKHTRHPSNCSWTRSTLTCPSLFEHKIFVFFTNIKLELFESEKNIIQIHVFGFIALSFFRLELKPKHRICPNSAEQYLFNATWVLPTSMATCLKSNESSWCQDMHKSSIISFINWHMSMVVWDWYPPTS